MHLVEEPATANCLLSWGYTHALQESASYRNEDRPTQVSPGWNSVACIHLCFDGFWSCPACLAREFGNHVGSVSCRRSGVDVPAIRFKTIPSGQAAACPSPSTTTSIPYIDVSERGVTKFSTSVWCRTLSNAGNVLSYKTSAILQAAAPLVPSHSPVRASDQPASLRVSRHR